MRHLARFFMLVSALTLAACGGSPPASPTLETTLLTSDTAPTVETASLVSQQPVIQQATIAVTLPAAESAPASLPSDEAGEALVASINGEGITLTDFQRTLTRYEAQQPQVADAAVLQTSVLETMIEQVLINQAAAQQGIAVSDEELDAEIASNRALAGSDEAWATWLATNQYSEEEFRDTLRDTLITGQVLNSMMADLSNPVPHVHARHILVETEAIANEVLTRLNNGEDFAALAAEYSVDATTARQGGDLGWFTADELLEPALARVAFSLQANMVAGPIQTMLGYHIMQTLELADRPIPPEQLPEVMETRFENWVNSLVAAATIERYL